MTRRIYWGLVPLIILLIGISAVMLMRNTDTELDINVYKPLSPEEEEQVERNIQDAIEKSKTPTARPGYKLVQHGDHYHEVPISETEVLPQNKKSAAVPKTVKGGLTYHAELLESNPVKALRLQSEERGHWSKDHIPPFPPSDTEAQEFAKNIYLVTYYQSLGYGYGNLDPEDFDSESNRIYGDAARAYMSQGTTFSNEYEGARSRDLWRLTWTRTDAGEITPYGGMYPIPGTVHFGRARMFQSDYFPDFIDANGREIKLTAEDFFLLNESIVPITE